MEGFCVFSSTYNLQNIHDNWEIDNLQLLPKEHVGATKSLNLLQEWAKC
jgi:hypothetical protein